MIGLEVVWFLVIGISVIFYVVLDGFDLGVGMLHLFANKDQERRVFLNSIGPVWDGNGVWLVIVGGALFAGFPEAYATLFSAFYTLCMILLCGLIFRVVAIEFRSKQASKVWRYGWDTVFCVSSFIIAFSIGIIMGNLVQGIALDEHRVFIGKFSDFFSWYPILAGFTSISLLMMHGSIYLVMKTEGVLHDRLRRFVNPCLLFFTLSFITISAYTWVNLPHMTEPFEEFPVFFLLPLCTLLAVANVPRSIHKKQDGFAFMSSSAAIIFLLCVFGVGTFPILARSSISPETNSVSVFNAASSMLTLNVLMVIVGIGIPLVIAYGIYVYRVFRGKVKLDKHSY